MSTIQIDEQLLDKTLTEVEQARQWGPRVIAKLETAIRTALAECRGLEVYRILDRALAEGQDK